MEIRTLRSFLAVAREGNVTRAAQSLHITQPALSRQLAELERELGCDLLVREPRGVTLTDEGMLLRKRAEEIVSLTDRTELEMRSPTAEIAGDVWIGSGESRAIELIAAASARLAAHHPGVRVRLFSGNADDVLERTEKGLLDFGILMGREPSQRYETLDLGWQDRWGALVPHSHRFASQPSITLADLAGERLIVSTQSPGAAPTDVRPLEQFRETGGQIVSTYTLLYNASLFVEQGVGIAICFDGIIATGEGTPFAFVPIKDLPTIPSRMIWKRHQPLSRAAAALLSTLQEMV